MVDRHDKIKTAVANALAAEDGERTPLDLVGEIPLVEAVLDEIVAERVDAARAQGLSWHAIAERLGISRQAAHKRFVKGRKLRRPGIELQVRLEGRNRT